MAAHFGIKNTFNRIAEQHFWPKIRSDMKKYVLKCEVCNEQNYSRLGRIGLMSSPKKINIPFQLISIDFMGPFPRSKLSHRY